MNQPQRTAIVLLRPGDMAYIPSIERYFAEHGKATPQAARAMAYREISEVIADPVPRAYLTNDRYAEYPVAGVYLSDPKVECRRLFRAFVESYERAYGFVPQTIHDVSWVLP